MTVTSYTRHDSHDRSSREVQARVSPDSYPAAVRPPTNANAPSGHTKEMNESDNTASVAEIEAAIEAAVARRDEAQRRAEQSRVALKNALSAELTSTQKLLGELDRRHEATSAEIVEETRVERSRIIDEARELAATMTAFRSSNTTTLAPDELTLTHAAEDATDHGG
jgi:hypothetical protein